MWRPKTAPESCSPPPKGLPVSLPALIATCLAIAAGYLLLVTQCTGRLIGPEWLSSSFDSLGEHLLRGEADVDPNSIKWEALKIGGKSYAYFGLFPALLRIALNALHPGWRGEWARVSCLSAALLAVAAFSSLLRLALAQNRELSAKQRQRIWLLLTVGFAFGTPLLYLVSSARIYHEAIVWGLCGSMWGLYALARAAWCPERRVSAILLFSCALFVTWLSRVTFGLPLVLAAPALLFWCLPPGPLLATNKLRSLAIRCLAMSPAAAALALGAWYNYARFGSVWTFCDYNAFYLKPAEIGGELNLSRIPSALLNYLGFFANTFSSTPPWVNMSRVEYLKPGLFTQGWREETLSLTTASPWLLGGAMLGLYSVLRRRVSGLLMLYSALLALQAGIVTSFFFVTQRYASELLPLLVLLLAISLTNLKLSKGALAALAALVLWSSFATVAATLHWNMAINGDASKEYKRFLRGLFLPSISLPNRSGRVVYLNDLPAVRETSTFTPSLRNTSALKAPLDAAGESYPYGIGMHAHSTIAFAVPLGMTRLTAILATSPSMMNCDKMSFRFRVRDERGVVLFESEVIRGKTPAILMDIPLGSTTEVTLQADGLSDGFDCDHANWIMANFNEGH